MTIYKQLTTYLFIYLYRYLNYISSLFFITLFKIKNFYSKNRQKQSKPCLNAIGSIEMILLLLVLVSLIVIFKSQITSIINTVFTKIRQQINGF
jgi:hypothetical protein